MEDVLTELPPPSRFFLEDLNNFTPRALPLPPPFTFFSTPNPKTPLKPSLLIVAISTPSLHLLHHLPLKTLIGTLILPEISPSGNSINPSLNDKSCNLYSLKHNNQSIIIANFQYPDNHYSPERTYAIAKSLFGQTIVPDRVLIFDSIQARNFHGRISRDDTLALKLETKLERNGGSFLKKLDYFPSGSVMEGLGSALLGRAQMGNIKGTLCVSWPEFGGSVTAMIKDLLVNDVLPGIEVRVDNDGEDDGLRFGHKNRYLDSELYT